jgi:hypothetical protein
MMVNFNLLKHVGLLPDGGGASGRSTSGLGTRQVLIEPHGLETFSWRNVLFFLRTSFLSAPRFSHWRMLFRDGYFISRAN